MAKESFTWAARVGMQGSATLRVRSAQFGDGYKQAVADGINSKVQSWPLSFVGRSAKIKAIQAFLDRHGGWRSFYWTPPLGELGLYRASAYTTVPEGGDVHTLSVTFEQAFAP